MTDNSVLLKEKIIFLEARQNREISLFREQVQTTYESLKPINLLKDTLEDFTAQPDLKENIFDGIAGVATGFLSNKLIVGVTSNPVKKLAGTLLQIGISAFVAKNSSKIRAIGEVFLKHFFGGTSTFDKK